MKSGQLLATTACLAICTAAIVPAVAFGRPVNTENLRVSEATTLLGPTAADHRVSLAIILPSRDPDGLSKFLSHLYERGDPQFHQFVTPSQFAERFGVPVADYAAVKNWAIGRGLAVGEDSAARTVIAVSGSAAAVQSAFGVTLQQYRTKDGRQFYLADRPPEMPDAVASMISGVVGFSSYVHFAPLVKIRPATVKAVSNGTGPGGAYSAADLRTLYGVQPQSPAGITETLAVFEQGGFTPSDVAKYVATNKLPNVPVIVRGVDGYGGGVNDPLVELEAVLDIDMEIALNPAAGKIIAYEDGNVENFGVALIDSLTAMANDDRAETIDISYGTDEAIEGETQIAAEGLLFQQLAAQGQAVFVSAGDQGAYGRSGIGLNASDPGSQPFITSVGGTTLFSGPKNTYLTEEVWNDLSIGLGATGGGVSLYWTIPAYQIDGTGQSFAVPNGGSATLRNMPDVAAVANSLTGPAIYSAIQGGWLQPGGTSVSAPIWAGVYSLLNAASKGLGVGKIGFFNPGLYATASAYLPVHDIADGSNGNVNLYGVPGYNAGYGYDNTTGWGSPDTGRFIIDYTLGALAPGSAPPPAPTDVKGSVTDTTASLTWKRSAGATGYLTLGFLFTGPQSYQSGRATTATFTGLTADSLYTFEVYAVSPGGIARSLIFLHTKAK